MVSIRRRESGLVATGSAWLVLALSITAITAERLGGIPGTVVYREGSEPYKPGPNGKGPWGDDLIEFSVLLASNKTTWGSVPFEYPDISKNWLEVSDRPGWSWDITLKGDVGAATPLSNGSIEWHYQTEGFISLQTPTSNNGSALPVDKEWNMCLLHWDLANGRYNDKLRSDDGSCSSVLSEGCRDALRRRVEDAFVANGTCACTTAAAVPECAAEEAAGAAGPWDSGCAAEAADARDMAGWIRGGKPVFAFAAGDFYDAGDRANYNDLGSVAWPVLSVLAGVGATNSSSSSSTAGEGVTYFRSQLSCVRATHAFEGWDVPDLAAANKNTTNTDRPAQTSAASSADVGSFGAFLLGMGFLVTAFAI